MHRLILALLFSFVSAGICVAREPQVISPQKHLGRAIGTDFTLVDWNECSGYYKKLAEQSRHVRLSVEGKTTEGRDFLLAVISSEANLQNLDRLKTYAKTIADPRGASSEDREAALREGKVLITITPAMHSTEVAGTQFAMQFAYELATSDEEPWKSARDNAVVLLLPSLNPDGLDHVVEWYRTTVETPYEATGMLKLYQLYTGHDNNRDFFMLTQAETKILSRLMYHEWRPQVHWDVHQQGSGAGERMFLPPFRDPLNPNLDPGIVAATNLVGMRAVLDMTREGLTGIATASKYENWAGSTNRSIPTRHNITAILTECTSANLASPMFIKRADLKPVHGKEYGPSNQYVSPWPGGWWRIGDIIKYEMSFGRSLLATINREPRTWLSITLDGNAAAVENARREGLRGWIIPSDQPDPAAVTRLIDSLIGSGIEVHVSEAELTLDGRRYPGGSVVIRRDQPWATHVKDLFDIQRYPKGFEPYDVAGWTLPLLMGVRRVEVMQSLDEVALKRVDRAADAVAAFAGDPRVKAAGDGALCVGDSSCWTKVAAMLGEKQPVTFVTRGDRAGLFIPGESDAATHPSDAIVLRRLPRIGIYAPWSGSMDEGWLRWVFDTWKIPYVSVRNEQLRAGELADFLDVLIVPSISSDALSSGRAIGSVHEQYAGGLSPEGSLAIDEFVRGGGTLITFATASKWAIELFKLPLTDVTAPPKPTTAPADPGAVTAGAEGAAGDRFYCPGSVLRAVPARDPSTGERYPLTAALPDSLPLMFATASAWREPKKRDAGDGEDNVTFQTLLRYAPSELLLSGYINKPETIANHAAWMRAQIGDGRVHLFAFQPHYRSWSQACFGLIFRAALFEPPPNHP